MTRPYVGQYVGDLLKIIERRDVEIAQLKERLCILETMGAIAGDRRELIIGDVTEMREETNVFPVYPSVGGIQHAYKGPNQLEMVVQVTEPYLARFHKQWRGEPNGANRAGRQPYRIQIVPLVKVGEL